MAFFSLGMVVVSTLTFILSTMEDQEHDGKETAFSRVLDVIDAGVIIYFTLVSIDVESLFHQAPAKMITLAINLRTRELISHSNQCHQKWEVD